MFSFIRCVIFVTLFIHYVLPWSLPTPYYEDPKSEIMSDKRRLLLRKPNYDRKWSVEKVFTVLRPMGKRVFISQLYTGYDENNI